MGPAVVLGVAAIVGLVVVAAMLLNDDVVLVAGGNRAGFRAQRQPRRQWDRDYRPLPPTSSGRHYIGF